MKHYFEKFYNPIKEMYCDWKDGYKRVKVKYSPEKGYSVSGWFLSKKEKEEISEKKGKRGNRKISGNYQ